MNKIIEFIKKEKIYFISFALIIFGFHICYGINIVYPSNINWLMSAYHDWGQHYLGWAYFQNEPWHFPLGRIENFNYPAGTNVGYTDSIPLLAVFFKIFSFLLPDTFQYLGIWLLACHLLTGYFTIKILKLYNANLLYTILAVLLVALNPMLIYRGLHPALCGHWLIVASLYYYLIKPTSENVKSVNKKQIIILILSALINPYLCMMVIGFNIILPLKNYFYDKIIPLKNALLYIFISVFSVLFSWFILGMVTFENSVNMEVVNSYGLYSFNLNSFYNAGGFSTYLPQYKLAQDQQYEGYAYLGLGILLLVLISTIYFLTELFLFKKTKLKNKGYLLLLVVATVTALFAITNKITLNENTALDFSIPDLIIRLGGIFRASGRFIWILYYLILFFAVLVYIKSKFTDKIKIPVLTLLVLLQIYDTKTLFLFRDLPSGSYEMKKMNEKSWTQITSQFKRVMTYPPFENNLLTALDYQDFCFVALKSKLPITCGYVARDTGDSNKIFSDSLNINLSEGVISEGDLYITTPKHLDAFLPLIYQKKVELRYLEGYYYLYAANSKNKVAFQKSAIETHKTDSIYKEIEKSNTIKNIAPPKFQVGKIKVNLEKNTFNNNIIQIAGWAFLDNTQNNKNDSIYIALTNETKTYIAKAKPIQRPDVTGAFKKENLDNSGFTATIFTEGIENKNYNLAIAIKDKNNQWVFQKFDQSPLIDLKKRNPPKLITSLPPVKEKIICNVEKVDLQVGNLYINGWAAIENQDASNSVIHVVLINGKTMYEVETEKTKRKDVTAYFKNAYNYNDAGFNLKTKIGNLKPGKYAIGLIVKSHKNQKTYYLSDKTVVIK